MHKTTMVERMAMAMYRSRVEQVRNTIKDIAVAHTKIQRALTEASNETDRASSILIFALMDDTLEFYMRSYMNAHIRGGLDSVFSGTGMLSTAHSRITLAAMLDWVSHNTYTNFNIVRRVRNTFAHRTDIDGFGDTSISGLVHSLSPTEKIPLNAAGIAPPRPLEARELFLARCAMLQQQLTEELVVRRPSIAATVSPKDVLNVHWEDTPDNLRELRYITVRSIIKIANLPDDGFGGSGAHEEP